MKQLQLSNRKLLQALAILVLALAFDFQRASAAVVLRSFSAKAQSTTILIQWTTASETSMSGFYVLRGTALAGPYSKISGLIPVQFPNSLIGSSYSFTDANASNGQIYYFKLQAVEARGATQDFGPVNAAIGDATATLTTRPSTSTPTTVVPTATRTSTAVAARTATLTTDASATATGTTILGTSSLLADSTPTVSIALTSTPFPTRVALFVDPSAPTRSLPTPAIVRPSNSNAQPPAPPKPIEPVAVPTTAGVAQNPISQNPPPDSNNLPDEPASDQTPPQSTETNPLIVALTLAGGVTAMIVIAGGAAAFYLLARKFIR